MKNKIFGITICILLIFTTIIPIASTLSNKNIKTLLPEIVDKSKPINKVKSSEIFISSYIETTLYGEFELVDLHPEFGFLLYMPQNNNRETTIYSEKGGDILWHCAGEHGLKIGLFIGYNENKVDISIMYGRAIFVKPILD
jgi:hypothetical protein